MTRPTISAFGAFPDRSAADDTFDVTIDARYSELEAFPAEVNALAEWMETTGDSINTNVGAAQDARDEAEAAALSAAGSAAAWSSGASYSIGDNVWSPVNYATYRAKTNHSGETTDPSLDTTNWAIANPTSVADSPTITGVTTLTATAEIVASLSGATPTLDKQTANAFTITTSANTTVAISNAPAGKIWFCTIIVTMGGNHTFDVTGADWGDAGPPTGLGTGDELWVGLEGIGTDFIAFEKFRKSA
jgi:hypothetical protein